MRLWNWLGAYAPCWPSMLLSLLPAVLGNIYDNKPCFLFAGICIGIAIHQWIIAYATYGLKGKL